MAMQEQSAVPSTRPGGSAHIISSPIATYALKVIVALTAIVLATVPAATLKSASRSRKGINLLCQASPQAPYHRVLLCVRVSLWSLTGSPGGACS